MSTRPGARRATAVVVALLLALPSMVRGQSPGAPSGTRVPTGSEDAAAPIGQDTERAPEGGARGARQLLEQRVRERFEEIVRQRLQLTQDQMRRLRETNQRFGGQRRVLSDQERELRVAIRAELAPGHTADQTHVAALADSLIAVQRQRLDILQAEQRDLAGFLTPVQRVRYYALQEQLRRRVDQIRQRRQVMQALGARRAPAAANDPTPDSESP